LPWSFTPSAFGDIPGQITEPEHRDQDLKGTDQNAEQEQRLEQNRPIFRVQERQRAEHQ
jgi:hypothetical protein